MEHVRVKRNVVTQFSHKWVDGILMASWTKKVKVFFVYARMYFDKIHFSYNNKWMLFDFWQNFVWLIACKINLKVSRKIISLENILYTQSELSGVCKIYSIFSMLNVNWSKKSIWFWYWYVRLYNSI